MISFPYTSIESVSPKGKITYDRASNSENERALNGLLYTDGVDYRNPNAYKVIAGEGMTVQVKCGGVFCKVGNCWGYEPAETRTLTVGESDIAHDKIVNIILRNSFEQNSRKIDLYHEAGEPSLSPVAPTPTNNATIQEKVIAQVYIPKNTYQTADSRITDTRFDSSLCGVMGHAMGSPDFTPYFTQVEALILEYQQSASQSLSDLQEAIENIVVGADTMLKSVYDTDNDGVVDKAAKLSVPRKINNVAFDGTEDIVVKDNTKMLTATYDPNNKGIDVTVQTYTQTSLDVLEV